MDVNKVLYISQEITPYLNPSDMATFGRMLPQGIRETGMEVRTFMPRYGAINERRNQLHEVIRLSGLNIVIDDTDHPLIIKVAIPPTASRPRPSSRKTTSAQSSLSAASSKQPRNCAGFPR